MLVKTASYTKVQWKIIHVPIFFWIFITLQVLTCYVHLIQLAHFVNLKICMLEKFDTIDSVDTFILFLNLNICSLEKLDTIDTFDTIYKLCKLCKLEKLNTLEKIDFLEELIHLIHLI